MNKRYALLYHDGNDGAWRKRERIEGMATSVLKILVDGGDVELALLGTVTLEGERLGLVGIIDGHGHHLLAIGIGRKHQGSGRLERRGSLTSGTDVNATHTGTKKETIVGRCPEHLGGHDGAVVLDRLARRAFQREQLKGYVLVERHGRPPLPSGGIG